MSQNTFSQPKLGDLMARFLNQRAEATAAGLEAADPSEVTPYEAGPVQPIDAKLAWEGATAAAAAYAIQGEAKGAAKLSNVPPQWAQLVAAHEPVVALAFAAGNFPQLVRNFQLILQKVILQKGSLSELAPTAGRPTLAPALVEWARAVAATHAFPQVLMAIGALRLAKNFAEGNALVEQLDGSVPAGWRAAWDNERAALLWHQGKTEEARALWNKLEATAPVLFNRGMAELFLGNPAKAKEALGQAVAALSEASAWHHLANLYLTLAK